MDVTLSIDFLLGSNLHGSVPYVPRTSCICEEAHTLMSPIFEAVQALACVPTVFIVR